MELKNRTLSNFADLVQTGECKKFKGRLKVGVDLGTANTVLAVVDTTNRPIAGISAPSQAIRDGVIVNYYESVQLVTRLKAELEEKLKTELPYAAAAIPPGVSEGSSKSIQYVLEGAGFEVSNIVDEPTKKLSKNRKVCISYPEDVKLQELEIEMGAGTVYLNRDIETEKLSVEMGAGEFESKNPVTAREADLEIGTGSMTFADLSARKTDGECGLGELDLTLTGTQEDYNYDLECGVGNLDVGSDSYSGLGREKTISNKGADRKLDLECGMGNISVDFSGKEHRDLQIS